MNLHLLKITRPSEPFSAEVNIPGSKSYSLRALFISALCDDPAPLRNLLDSDDTAAMKNALSKLNDESKIFVNESGITARFMTSLACLKSGNQTIYGKPSLNARPIGDLVDALKQLGANIKYLEKEGFMPISIESSELNGGSVKINGNISSQYISALLLIAPLLKDGLVIKVEGKQTSKPYINMTIDIMEKFGVKVKNNDYLTYEVLPQKYVNKEFTVEGDYSSAAYFFAAAALNKSKVTVHGLDKNSLQADKSFLKVLERFGAKVEVDSNSVTVVGRHLKSVNVNMGDCPDQAMTAAVLASFAQGRSTIRGVASLRIKETERVEAVQFELSKMGVKSRSTKDVLTVFGGKPKPTKIDTYGDHRIAMSFALAGTRIDNLEIINPDVVNKTFPNFWTEFSKITSVNIYKKNFSNILLIGMRGTGKSTTGKFLAKKVGKKFIDMDRYIEDKEQMKIRDIVLKNGWKHFRNLESKACEDLKNLEDYVIASGGGVVLNQRNIDLFRQSSVICLINANPRILSKRIRKDKNRLGLTGQPTLLGELSEVWKERRDLYFSACDFVVKSDRSSSKNVAKQIIDKIEL